MDFLNNISMTLVKMHFTIF